MPLSYSQLSAYRSCPRQYEYAHVKKIKAPMTPEASFGVSMHSTLKKWGELERAFVGQQTAVSPQSSLFAGEDPAAEQQLLTVDRLLDLWTESFIIDCYATRMEADYDRERGKHLLQHFFDWWGREERTVLAVEKGFSLDIDGETVTGRFDRVEEGADGSLRVIDYKTGVTRNQTEVDADLQLSLYALAARKEFGRAPSALIMLILNDEGLREIVSRRENGELQTAMTSIQLLAGRIGSRDYHPTPGFDACRKCPYRRVCDVSAAR